MCLAVYIASNVTLPLVEWDEKQPGFNITSLSGYGIKVEKQFVYQHVVYAGPHEGCGCGFFKEGEVGDELAQVQLNYDSLALYLKSKTSTDVKFEIYSCWEGDQEEEPEFKEKIEICDLMAPEFEFKEKAYYEIV